MNTPEKSLGKTILKILITLGIILTGSFIFALQQPNFIFKDGLGFLGFFSYIPVLIVLNRSNVKSIFIYGALFGTAAYGITGYWVVNYGIWGMYLLLAGYFFVYGLYFLALKLISNLYLKNQWIILWLAAVCFEYVKSKGFLGINYGVTAYSQWKNIYLIQICDLIGVFGLNAIVLFPSFAIYSLVSKTYTKKNALYKIETDNTLYQCKTHLNYETEHHIKLKLSSRTFTVVSSVVWVVVFISCFVYGKVKLSEPETKKTITVAAIQHNEDPFKDGVKVYKENLNTLINLTEEAINDNPDVKLVLWPETAFVPSIMYQFYVKKEPERLKMINTLLSYVDNRDAAFIIGNGNTVIKNGFDKLSYNSALFFNGNTNALPPNPEIYDKIHLVPFSEYFPYENVIPALYDFLQSKKTFWTPGTEYKVFEYNDLFFSTPICFEDTFADVCRKMCLAGSKAFFNLSNDSWAKSVAAQNQHLSMAVFRSIENRVPSIRSCTSGQTCIINTKGQITEKAEPFTESFVIGEIPVISSDSKLSFYTKCGDFVPLACGCLLGLLLIIQIITVIIKKIK